MDFWLKPLAVSLLAAVLVPFAVTQLLFCGGIGEGGRRRLRAALIPGTLLNLLGNGLAAWGLQAVVFRSRNPLPRLTGIWQLTCSSRDPERLALAVLGCLAFSIPFGRILRALFFAKTGWGVSRRQKAGTTATVILCLLPVLAGLSLPDRCARQLRIQEVGRKVGEEVSNASGVPSFGRSSAEISYVDLFNPGEIDCETGTLWLSETEEELQAYRFLSLLIPAGQRVRLVMSYDHGLDLKKEGTSQIWLSDAGGQILDHVSVPGLQDNECCRREKAEADWEVVRLDRLQAESAAPGLRAPVFSHGEGFYSEAFELELSSDPGTVVHYTLDCSLPTAESPVADGPIPVYNRSEEENRFRSVRNVQLDYPRREAPGKEPVDKAFVVRAVAMDAEGNRSETVTRTFFVGLDQYRDRGVVSLVADPEDLFGAEKGIYVTGQAYDDWYQADGEAETEPVPNFMQKGINWECPAVFSLFREGESFLHQPVGIRIQGHGARKRVLKRFSIFARTRYSGSRTFDEPLFGDYLTHSVVLREGTHHALAQRLGEGRDLFVQPWCRTVLFLNGEYWYESYLMEKATQDSIAARFGLLRNNVCIVKNGAHDEMTNLGENPYSAIRKYIRKNDLSVQENYEAFDRIMDIQSYIDMACFQIYLANQDYREAWNSMVWHTVFPENEQYGDSRWRWGLYDMDLKWSSASYPAHVKPAWVINPFVTYGTWQKTDGPITEWPLYSALRKSPLFCRNFVLCFMDLVNTVFQPDHVLDILEEMDNTDQEISDFFRNRPPYAVQYLAEEFGLTGTGETVTLRISDPEAGILRLNTVTPDLSSGSWTGTYFTDYPIRLTAEARDGYRFSHWEADGEILPEETVEILPRSGGTTVSAVFLQE